MIIDIVDKKIVDKGIKPNKITRKFLRCQQKRNVKKELKKIYDFDIKKLIAGLEILKKAPIFKVNDVDSVCKEYNLVNSDQYEISIILENLYATSYGRDIHLIKLLLDTFPELEKNQKRIDDINQKYMLVEQTEKLITKISRQKNIKGFLTNYNYLLKYDKELLEKYNNLISD